MHPIDPNLDIFALVTRWLHDLLAALAPAIMGSAVGQAWKTGLSWRQRLVQWLTGILVSYYVTLGLTEWMHWGPFVAQAIGFVMAMMAFEVAPKLIAGVGTAFTKIPEYVANFLPKSGGGPGTGA